MRYLGHFLPLLGSIVFVWALLLVVGFFLGFDHGLWLTGALLFGVLGPLMVLFGGLRTTLRRWRWRDYGFSQICLPLMYYRGTERLDASGQALLNRRGEPVLAKKPPENLRHACCVALLSPATIVLCRADKQVCEGPIKGIPWNDLNAVLAEVPLTDLRGIDLTLFDAEEIRQAQAADLSGRTFFTAMLSLTWSIQGGEQRRAVFGFSRDQGKAPVREAITQLLSEGGLPTPGLLRDAGKDNLVASQGVADAVAAYLRAWAG
ncbi:hypothetical protein K8B33_03510 [Alcanivorax sp. JB21]|uniref:hypothetical protein n=1 Tax=Alcanivorax limicola TaxID=2874102 RepID=UPI001CBE8675|nr:hypothetical protein [Alcanivorax limicola]MBZ2188147.1 hypothetical protein [Alcanivorax limicola]